MASSARRVPQEKKRPLFHWKVKNFVYEDYPHPTIKLRCPGLSHESFDRDLKPKIMSIMMTSAVARATALRSPIRVVNPNTHPDGSNTSDNSLQVETFLDFTKLSNDYFTFMSSTEFVMSPALYDNSIPKWPIDMKFTHGYVGNSSVANVSEFFACNEEDERNASELGHNPLWTNTYQIVLIDKTTRKPTHLPDWFKEKFKGKGCREKGFILKTFSRPPVTFSQPFKVQWTDTDQYNHTNFTTYIRWALDTLHASLHIKEDSQIKPSDAPIEGDSQNKPIGAPDGTNDELVKVAAALPYINKAMLAQGLHKMQVTYLRECLEGESVEIHAWQEEGGDKELVLFSVVKNGEDVCQVKMWYFPAD